MQKRRPLAERVLAERVREAVVKVREHFEEARVEAWLVAY